MERNYVAGPSMQEAPRTSAMAIWAFVLSLLPICFLSQLTGLILGIFSLVNIGKSQGRLKGKGLAIAAVVISPSLMLFSLLMLAMLLPAVARARGEARKMVCRSNLNQIGKAIYVYRDANNDKFPTTETPGDSAGSLALLCPDYIDAKAFICASDPDRKPGMAGASLTEETCSYYYDNTVPPHAPSDRMIVWDKSPDWHYASRNVLFVDGHVEHIREDEFQRRLADQGVPGSAPSGP